MVDYRHAVYAGSFDPVTLGHTSIIERASRLYERVTVAVGANPDKSGTFPAEERVEIIRETVRSHRNVKVESFRGLLVTYCQSKGAGVLLRGMRLLTDFEYEFQLGLANRDLDSRIETVYMFTESEHVYISSSLVKQIAMNGGDASRYLPPAAWRALAKKFQT
ncbi:MAG: pantetheine-phosphate adenylyltransferase [Myxococcota bacterium]